MKKETRNEIIVINNGKQVGMSDCAISIIKILKEPKQKIKEKDK